ncbi:MAG: hypothetical protein Q9213_001486 [Squamulea squamosa]
MDITSFIVNQRNTALLVGDYGLYRKQLSRRLLVVHKKLNYSTKGRKYSPKSPITVEDITNNHEFIQLLLLTAERAWALAMYMKSTHTANSNVQGTTGSTKRHIISKLQKASSYAAHLVSLLKEKDKSGASTESILEARAYHQSLQGAIEFEKKIWEQCLQSYSETRLLFTALAQTVGTKRDDIFRDLLASTIDPSMRYAAYQLKLPRTVPMETIVARYVQRVNNSYVEEVLKSNPDLLKEPGTATKNGALGTSADPPQIFTWRSRTVNIEDANTAQALASVSAAETTLASFLAAKQDLHRRAKAAAFDDVLIPSQDAVDAVKTAIDELTAEGLAQGDPRMQSLQITRTAVNYNLVELRIGRNRVLCGKHDGARLESESVRKLTKPRADGNPQVALEESAGRKLTRLKERVVLYDSIIQSLDSVKGFPGVAADQAFVQELEAKKAYFTSLKCFAIARSQILNGNKRNALALLRRAADLSSRSILSNSPASPTADGIPKSEVCPAQVMSLNDLLERTVLQYQALVDLEDSKSETLKNDTIKLGPMIERLDEYPPEDVELTKLVTYPPKVQPIPVKPIFLDAAWNYIDYPGRRKNGTAVDVKVEEAASKYEPKKEVKKGCVLFLTGFHCLFVKMTVNGTWASPLADAQYSVGFETGGGRSLGQVYDGMNWYSLVVILFLLLVAYDQFKYIWNKGSIVGPAWKMPFIGPFLSSVNPKMDEYKAKWASGDLSCVSVFHKFVVIASSRDMARKVFNSPAFVKPCVVDVAQKLLRPKNWVFLDGRAHVDYRKGLNGLFTRQALETYLPGQEEVYEKYFAKFLDISHRDNSGKPIPFMPIFRELMCAVSCRTFVGHYMSDAAVKKIADDYYKITAALELVNFPIIIPFTRTYYGKKAADMVLHEFSICAAKSKARMAAGGEITCIMDGWITSMLDSENYRQRVAQGIKVDDSEKPAMLLRIFSNFEIAMTIFTFLFASQDATSSASTWLFQIMADRPEILDRVRKENLFVRNGDKDQKLSIDMLEKMPYTRAVVKETLRYRPPVIMVPYVAKKAFPVTETYTAPKGSMVIPSVWPALHDPEVYPAPDTFDPERWISGDAEKAVKNWLVFGTGPHYCLGQTYAQLNLMAMIGKASMHLDWVHHITPLSEDIKVFATIFPMDDCPLVFSKRN